MKTLAVSCCLLLLADIFYSADACTIFTSSSKNAVLAGNNEDMCTTNTMIHILPPSDDKYGRIFWGFKGDGNYQGGMNEHGLFFDGAGTPPVKMSDWNLPEFEGRYIMETVLEKCKTVQEAIDFVKDYSQPYLKFSHILAADASGDAVIFEWGNNRMNFIRKDDENYLIATNFNLTECANPEKQCNRYSAVKKMLSENEPTVDLFENILSVTHAEGKFPTVYSNVCDLKNGKMYLYNFHNFSFRKDFDLQQEFEKGEQKYLVRTFFPETNSELIFRLMNDCIDDFDDLPLHAVTFIVNTPNLPENTALFLQGSAKELGEWDGPGIEMDKKSATAFQKTISFKEGKLFDFALATTENNFAPYDSMNQKIAEQVLEIKSDTVITIPVFDWKAEN